MAVKYVSEFSFPSDFGFHKNGSASVPGKKHGGKVSTPQPYKGGGEAKYSGHEKKHAPNIATKGAGASNMSYVKTTDKGPPKTTAEKSSGVQAPAFKRGGKSERHKGMMSAHMARRAKGGIAEAPVKMGEKSSWNKDDAVSPGSYKKTPPKQSARNKDAVKDKFAAKDTDDATKQTGDVERMSGFSDFKKGGRVHKKAKGGHVSTPQPYKEGGHAKGCSCKMCSGGMVKKAEGGHNRLKNLGKYAHGGKVYTDGSTQKPGGDEKYEKAAGTPKRDHMASKGERSSGKAEGKSKSHAEGAEKRNGEPPKGEKTMANGGLTRGTSAKRNAAIHAKEKHSKPGIGLGALAALAGAGPAGAMKQAPGPGMGPTPPGMAPGMGSPPGGQMGGMAPPPGPMGPGGMSHGGQVKHVFVHHLSHKG